MLPDVWLLIYICDEYKSIEAFSLSLENIMGMTREWYDVEFDQVDSDVYQYEFKDQSHAFLSIRKVPLNTYNSRGWFNCD